MTVNSLRYADDIVIKRCEGELQTLTLLITTNSRGILVKISYKETKSMAFKGKYSVKGNIDLDK